MPWRTWADMALPLFHSSRPLDPSNAYSTGDDAFETANTTPLITTGVMGEAISRDVQPGWSAGEPSWSATFQAATAS